ncbi:DUF4394 domain-containing protein [Scytonema sp. UIC 10036]|uniref:DUF4394 domain-containing protein n=1 Tax=Scytonema sp. UIC 10036 TaxID=2304196 RepID=UPI0012DAA08F|nr:DUF4394 domain-containing protein [Scytonema sp. UIC 10036]MUG91839.1 DUF4394 domain-containing protein [Scytonema sp. UIC 10036]
MTTAYVLSNNRIVSFDTSNPDNPNAGIPITGLAAGQNLVGIDLRPQNGKLYGIASDGMGNAQLYAISTQTGSAVAIGTLGQLVDDTGNSVAITGSSFEVDFNPTVDRLRIVTSNGLNFRVNPNTGAAIDSNVLVADINPDDSSGGGTTTTDATAYTNSAPNVTATTQYTLDSATNTLVIRNPLNNGTQTSPLVVTLNGSPLDFTSVNGFDIPSSVNVSASNTSATGQAFAVLTVGGQTGLYALELSTGAATLVGTVGAGTEPIQGFALENEVVPDGLPAIGLTVDGTQLLRFNSASAQTVTSAPVTGVAAGETLVGIDLRPATGQLYGLGINDAANTGSLYSIDPQTGTVTIVGEGAGQIAFVDAVGNLVDLPSADTGFGFDFNPTVDRIRVVTGTGLNFRLNPITGVAVDGNTGLDGINADGSVNGLPIGSVGISGTAYTNSFNGTTATTQYTLDATSNSLFIQNPPNNGTQTVQLPVTLNSTPLDFTEVSGFDIPSNSRVQASNAAASGRALAALRVGDVTNLYAIELSTGAATFLSPIGTGATSLAGLTVGEAPIGAVAFGTPTYTVDENGSAIALNLVRTGGSRGEFTVSVAATGGTATASTDYTADPITVTFADGQTTASATLNITDDNLIENNETVSLVLSNPTNGAVLASQDTATLNISDNDTVVSETVGNTVGSTVGNTVVNETVGNTVGNTVGSTVGSTVVSETVGNTVGTIAANFAANGSAIISTTNNVQNFVQFSLSSQKNTFVNEIVAFTVDDDLGTINGIAPNATGYLDAAIARSRTIFSTLNNNPNGFGAGGLSSTLDFGSNARFSTFLIQNGSLDELRAGQISRNNVFFSNQTSVRISNTTASNFTFGFEDSPNTGSNDFNDVVLQVNLASQGTSAGTALHGQGQSEVLDFSSLTGQVNTSFTVNREAAFDNFVGFYRVVDQNGGIDTNGDGTADILPGNTGYAQAAVSNRVTGIDFSVGNQQTATVSGQFAGGSIFAPFLIANGSVNQVLNGEKLDEVYFAYLGANSDRVDHIRFLGDNTFGFEDLRGGGDKDFNDVIMRVTI